MSMIKCRNCGSEISSDAISCPKCGQPFEREKKLSRRQTTCFVLFLLFLFWFFLLRGTGNNAHVGLLDIEKKVAIDAENQYLIAKRQGDPIPICVHAGMVAAAYIQAKDEPNYRKWKITEGEDCRRANIPH